MNNHYLFTGRRYDKESELYYYRLRYYAPTKGFFISNDAIRYSDSFNLHGFVLNNPLKFIDPFGLTTLVPVGTPCPDTKDMCPLDNTKTNTKRKKEKRKTKVYYHYTPYEYAASIRMTGLRPNSYGTPTYYPSSSQAKSELALPNRPDVVFEIDTEGLNKTDNTEVQKKYGEDGGGTETQFPDGVPPDKLDGPFKICP